MYKFERKIIQERRVSGDRRKKFDPDYNGHERRSGIDARGNRKLNMPPSVETSERIAQDDFSWLGAATAVASV